MTQIHSFKFWLIPVAIYGIPNAFLYWVSIEYGLIIVDMVPVMSSLGLLVSIASLVALILSFYYLVICGQLGSRFFLRVEGRPANSIVGFIVLVLQLVGLLSFMLLDYGRGGSTGGSSNALVVLLSYLHVDAIFLVYYGHRRSQGIPYFNLVCFLFSNTVRGWSGVWMLLFFIEVYYLLQRLPTKKAFASLAVIGALGIAAYPVINSYKDTVRGTVQLEESSLGGAMARLVVRLQQVTSTLLIAQERSNIEAALDKGEVRSYYADNTIGSKLLGLGDSSVSLQKYLSMNYLLDLDHFGANSDLDDLGWYVHTGIAGWLFVLDWYEIPVYLLFIALLIMLPYWIAARFIGKSSIIPVLHAVAILYMFHGWFGVQIGFIAGLLWYVALLNSIKWVAGTQALSRRRSEVVTSTNPSL